MATILHCNIPYGLRTYLSVHKNHHINLPALSWLNMSATKVRPQATNYNTYKEKTPSKHDTWKTKKILDGFAKYFNCSVFQSLLVLFKTALLTQQHTRFINSWMVETS